MTEQLIALLGRQFTFLLQRVGSEIFRELRRTLAVLNQEPRLALLIADECRAALDNLHQFDERVTATVAQFSQSLVRAPRSDDHLV